MINHGFSERAIFLPPSEKHNQLWRIMKLTSFLLLWACLHVSAASISQTLTLKAEKQPLTEVLTTVKKQTGYRIMYNDRFVRPTMLVSVDVSNQSLESVLDQLLAPQKLTYHIEGKTIAISRIESKQSAVKQWTEHRQLQERLISGTVTDEDGNPVEGVTVRLKGSQLAVATAGDGTYEIRINGNRPFISYSVMGYESIDVEVGDQTKINVSLKPTVSDLDEVVVVGYGTQKKINLTGSVHSVKGEDIAKRNVSTTSSALQGLIPGVSVVQSSGRPGADGGIIKVRGTGSINSTSNPLILIDGVEGDMNNIDLNSIESVSVLKDAASASIYGSRASNGVILVTTKRSQKGDLRISYNGFAGFNTPTEMPDPVTAIAYMEAINVARANSDQDPQYPQTVIDHYKTEGADNFNYYDTDWKKEVMKDRALMHNHSVSLSGGSERIQFFGNAGYFSQDGQIAHNSFKRMTLRMNTDVRITDWFRLGLDMNLRHSKTIRPSIEAPESIINKATTFVPVFSGINSDGTWGYGQNGDNPIASAEAGGLNTQHSPEQMLKGFLVLNPVKGLNLTSSYSSRRFESKTDYFMNPYDTYEGGVFKTSYPANGPVKYEGWGQQLTNQFNAQILYEKGLGLHQFSALAGMQTEEKKGRDFTATRRGYEIPGFEDIDHGDLSTATNSGGHYEWAMLSYYTRLNYSIKDRYLLELNGRWDASSRFKKDYRWGFFPSASAGWRVSEEEFFAPLKTVVSNLKFRGSYGILGNQDIYSYFPYAATISPGYGYWFDKIQGTGATQTQVANEKISWEKSSQMNIGLDAGVVGNKLEVVFDYYIRKIDDMLQQFPIPSYVGLSSPWENAGSMRNKGWDLSLTWSDHIGKVNYKITGNVADVKNRVTNLYGKEYVGTQITREGDQINSWFGYVSDGYFQSYEEIASAAVYGEKQNIKPGYIKYKDLSGPDGVPDGVINAFDRTIIGNPSPRFEYSFNASASWKGFDISLFLQGVGEKDIFYSGSGARPFYIGRSIFQHQLDYWTEDNRQAEFPILLIDGSGSNPNNIISDFWVKSGAYLRLKNLVVGYTLAKPMLNKIGFDRARCYVSAQNLFTFSEAYKGYDPENSVSGGSFYPLMRTFSFGIDINF